MEKNFIVALTGASGAAYGLKLIGELLGAGHKVDMITSPTARLIIKDEAGLDLNGAPKDILENLASYLGAIDIAKLSVYPSDLITAPLASGSALKRTMIICPCSMGTLGRVASGVSFNLIDRSADCILKERGELILVPRETPLNAIHLENMLKLSNAGAVIAPAMPAFYNSPSGIDDMVNFMVGKVLDLLGSRTGFIRDGKGIRLKPMLDIKYIRDNFTEAQARARLRDESIDLSRIEVLDAKRRELLGEVEALKQKRNEVSKEVARLKKEKADADDLVAEMQGVSKEIKALDALTSECEAELKSLCLPFRTLFMRACLSERTIRKIVWRG